MPIRIHVPLPGPLVYIPHKRRRSRARRGRREYVEAGFVLAAIVLLVRRPRLARFLARGIVILFWTACIVYGIYLYIPQ